MSAQQYDLVVIGSGPAGQRAAVAAAKLGKRVVVVEARSMVGGVCINTGTIPSKTMREAVSEPRPIPVVSRSKSTNSIQPRRDRHERATV